MAYVKLTEESEVHTHSIGVTISYKDDTVKYPKKFDRYGSNGIYLASVDTAARWIITAQPESFSKVRCMAYVRRVVAATKPWDIMDETGVARVSGVTLDPERIPVRDFFTVDQIIAATKYNPYVVLALTAAELAGHQSTLVGCVKRVPELLDLAEAAITDEEDMIDKIPSYNRHRIPTRFQDKKWYLQDTDNVSWSSFNADDQTEIAMAIAKRRGSLYDVYIPEDVIKPEIVAAVLDAAVANSHAVQKRKEWSFWVGSIGIDAAMMTPEQFRRCIIELETLPCGPVPDGHWDAGLLHVAIHNNLNVKDPPKPLMTKYLYIKMLKQHHIEYSQVPLSHDAELDIAAVTGCGSALTNIPVERYTAELLASAIKRTSYDSSDIITAIKLAPQAMMCEPHVLMAMAECFYPVYEFVDDPSVIPPKVDIAMVKRGNSVPQDRWTDDVASAMIANNTDNYAKLPRSQQERLLSDYQSCVSRKNEQSLCLDDYYDDFGFSHPYYDTMYSEFGQCNL